MKQYELEKTVDLLQKNKKANKDKLSNALKNAESKEMEMESTKAYCD